MLLPDDQPSRLRCFRNALRNWNFRGFVQFTPKAEAELKKVLPGNTLREIARQLHEFVEAGGKIDEQKECRPEYVSFEFHYDLRVTFESRRVYFETVLLCEDADDPDDPQIQIVSVHDV